MSFKFNPFTGTLDEVSAGGGGGTPGGSDTQVQFNDGGSTFGGDVDLTWNKTTNVLTVGGDVNLTDGGTYTTTLQTITPTANRTISFPDATGTVALVAGSSGQLLWNNAGANAGASTLTYDGSILTTSGRFINSYNATASSPAKTFTGTWFTGGTSTTTKPQVLIEPTDTTSTAWSTSGTGFGVNAASGFAGNLLDLQVNGTRWLDVSTFRGVQLYKSNATDNPPVGYWLGTGTISSSLSNRYGLTFIGSSSVALWATNQPGFKVNAQFAACVRNTASYGWTSGALSSNSDDTPDTQLFRDDAGIIAQRRGTAAQTFRVYNTFTDASNYERGFLRWSSNVFEVGPEAAGTGTTRPMRITAATLKLPNLPTYADNAAATTGGLVAGDVYKTATGELRITV